jgi:hypothetical protein
VSRTENVEPNMVDDITLQQDADRLTFLTDIEDPKDAVPIREE